MKLCLLGIHNWNWGTINARKLYRWIWNDDQFDFVKRPYWYKYMVGECQHCKMKKEKVFK